MLEIFRRTGLLDVPKEVNKITAAERKSLITRVSNSFLIPTTREQPRRLKRRVKDLIMLSQSPLPARAITLIRNGVTSLQYGLQPVVTDNSEKDKQEFVKAAEIVRHVLERPNKTATNFKTLLGKTMEDILTFDAGVWEYVEKPAFLTGNEVLAIEDVAGFTIVPAAKWTGKPDTPRWVQIVNNQKVQWFTNDELEYIAMRTTSASSFGFAPLETSVDIMDSWLNLAGYQAEIASNAYPAFMVWLGDLDEVGTQFVRNLWEMEIKGKGTPGFWGSPIGTTLKPETIELKPTTDSALFLKFQETLVRLFALCFGLTPMDFNLERDVNRNTASEMASASVQQARRPYAEMIASVINTRVIPKIAKITNNDFIAKLEYFWVSLDDKNDKVQADIHKIYGEELSMTVDEIRADLDKDPYPNDLGKMPPPALKALVETNPGIFLEPLQQPPSQSAEDDTNDDDPIPDAEPDFTQTFPYGEL